MTKESVIFGGAMGMKVAFVSGIAMDISSIRKLIWVSGQIAFNEKEMFIGKGDIKLQTEQVLTNIGNVLKRLGGTMDDVVQVTVFVKDIRQVKEIHDIRLKHFKEPYPTSTLVEVKGFVHPDALIEINALAAL